MKLPEHIAIIMDGNGRWAKKRFLPRVFGHRSGIESVRKTIKYCAHKGIKVLTLFAFSSENWQRPQDEVNELMRLFLMSLQKEVTKLHKNNVSLKIIGDTSKFNSDLQEKIKVAERTTAGNNGLKLVIAANYGGQWDITQAVQKIAAKAISGEIDVNTINENLISQNLSTDGLPMPDLFIRTSGEQRISNFLLWQLAYTELYFCDALWPDFSEKDLDAAINFYATRERRFGYVSEQIQEQIK